MRTDRVYIEVRKVKWDQLWHAIWKTTNGRISWDRVTPQEAMRIAYEKL